MKLLDKLLLIMLLITVGAGLGSGSAQAKDKIKSVTSNPENPLTPVDTPFNYTSEDGDFRVTWPSGCSSINSRTRADEDPGEADREYPVMVFCDRNGEKGEGCSVTAIFNARDADGNPAGPAEVIARMQNLLREFGAQIKRQSPLQKDFGEGLIVEGVDVQAAQTGGSGQVWLRGLLVGGDIYILSAWDLEGKLWTNPEYANFFNSFRPGTE